MSTANPPGTPVLWARRLSRTFGQGAAETRAVTEAAVDLYAGQVTLLMGPSGSGKSTLLAMLSGLLPPTGGQVHTLGQDLWRLSRWQRHQLRRRHCGFIFQGYNLFPALSARQQLEVVLRWGGVSGRTARRKAEQMLALFGLAQKSRLRPGELSGGEKQRVAVARALIKEPAFCFADEPTSALDWEHGRQVIELLQEAARRRRAAIVIVSHDQRILPYADQVYHMEDGRLQMQTGPPPPGVDPLSAPVPEEHPVPLRPAPSSRWGWRLPLMLALVLAAAALTATGWILLKQGRSFVPVNDSTVSPPPPPSLQDLVCIGYVDVDGGVLSLAPTISGRVEEVPIQENEPVRAGAVLLRLDSRVAQLQVREAEALVQVAKTQQTEARQAPEQHRSLVAQQKAALLAVQHELAAARLLASRKERMARKEEAKAAAEEVKKAEAAEQAEREKLHALKLRDPAQEVARAEANVLLHETQLARARHALEECALRAPTAGTVLRVMVHRGELLAVEAKQPALLFCPTQPRLVRAEVEQEFAGRVVVGQPAEVSDDAGSSERRWQGRVVRLSDWYAPRRMILPGALPVQDVRTLECLIQIAPGQAPLRIGQRVRVRLAHE